LSYGNSGVQLITVQRLIDFFNHDIIPVVYQLGSLGASGDLAPLAHLSLPLLGLGEVEFEGKVVPAQEVLTKFGWQPVRLMSKEGLALLNGTQFMSAHAVHSVIKARRLMHLANKIGSMSLDAFDGRIEPFGTEVNTVRAHPGQLDVANDVRAWLDGSELISRPKKHVQDPYSFRCMPQVHGAVSDSLNYVASVIETEINSPTDNPTIFPEKDLIVSAGNFHGEPIALPIPPHLRTTRTATVPCCQPRSEQRLHDTTICSCLDCQPIKRPVLAHKLRQHTLFARPRRPCVDGCKLSYKTCARD
jgi:histidine ammonia-lyase